MPPVAPTTSVPPGPSAPEVTAQLNRILSSPGFVASEQLCRFLRWCVEHALAGETDALKEYSLGRDVFDRGKDYDPRIDSIVRVEAQRLRRKLREFYDNAGREDPVIIEMPARGYVPGFRFARGVVSALQKPAERQLDPLTVAVLPFVYLGPEPDENLLAAEPQRA